MIGSGVPAAPPPGRSRTGWDARKVLDVQILGIDIGGSGVKGAPVDSDTGELAAERYRIETPQPSAPKAVAEVVGQVAAHFSWSGPVGVTFPGVVTRGTVHTAANMDHGWTGVDAAALFAGVLDTGGTGLPKVLNDADAAGVAEIAHGAGRGRDGVVLMLTFGTGIGSALFLDGKLVPNTELGHIELRGKDAELRASARIREEKKLHWGEWAERVQEYLSAIEALLSPDLVIIGGGVAKHADKFVPDLRLRAEVVGAQLANAAGIVGAAMAAMP